MEITEEQFIEMQKASMVTFVFATDEETMTATFVQNPGEEVDQGSFLVLYRIKGNAIVFYDSAEDMKNAIPAHKYGLLAGTTFELSQDKTTIIQTHIDDTGTIKVTYKVAQ